MIRAALSIIRLVAVLTAISMAAVGISVALSGFLRAQTATFTSSELGERTIQRRAVEAAIWGMPLVNVDAMRQAYSNARGWRSCRHLRLTPKSPCGMLRHRGDHGSHLDGKTSAGGAYAHSVLAIEEMEQARERL